MYDKNMRLVSWSFQALNLISDQNWHRSTTQNGTINPKDRKTTWGCHLILQPCKHNGGIVRFAVEADGKRVVLQAGDIQLIIKSWESEPCNICHRSIL